MKVRVSSFPRPDGRLVDLEDFLKPQVGSGRDEGAIERVASTADANACAIGRLMAALVRRGLVTFDEASEITGNYGGDLVP